MTPGYLGRSDWRPDGDHIVMSPAAGPQWPVAVAVFRHDRAVDAAELRELADRLNGGDR